MALDSLGAILKDSRVDTWQSSSWWWMHQKPKIPNNRHNRIASVFWISRTSQLSITPFSINNKTFSPRQTSRMVLPRSATQVRRSQQITSSPTPHRRQTISTRLIWYLTKALCLNLLIHTFKSRIRISTLWIIYRLTGEMTLMKMVAI